MPRILDTIESPEQLAGLSRAELLRLCAEIREEIITTVSSTGGHLGASLGVVELTVALHHVFRSPQDKIVWDVGHQAYGHKLLTGRRDDFGTLRQEDGVSGFPKRSESPHDAFGVGHASTSISAAAGFAAARDLKGEKNAVVAVIGDGALSGGLAFEGLNNAGQLDTDLIVVLNDNEMSISPNVGALAKYLTRITSGQLYTRFEADLWNVLGKLPKGALAQKLASRIKEGLKQIVVPAILFEELGFKYFGPIDGHDLDLVVKTLRSVRRMGGPVLIHLVTTKGKGYAPAEKERARYHGVGKFDREVGLQSGGAPKAPSYTDVFSREMLALAQDDPELVAITAAMPEGTGLDAFRDTHPERFFDVGIAEGHAVTFAAGLACEGLRPVCAIYSTFLQRAYDQVVHDVAIQKLPVIFAVDRGGVVGEDGPTHHGVLDLAYLRAVPDLVVMAPKDEHELRCLLRTAHARTDGPSAVRYPRGAGLGVDLDRPAEPIPLGEAEELCAGADLTLLALGSMVGPSVEAAERLRESGLDVGVVNMRFLKPLDEACLERVFTSTGAVLTVEEGTINGGLGSAVLEWAARRDTPPGIPVRVLGLPDRFAKHASRDALLREHGLDADSIAENARRLVNRRSGEARARAAH